MSADFSIQAATPAEPRPAAYSSATAAIGTATSSTSHSAAASSSPQSAASGQAAAAALRPSPSSYLDPALGLVVLEFTSENGSVVTTIPDAQRLAALHRELEDQSDPSKTSAAASSVHPTTGPAAEKPVATSTLSRSAVSAPAALTGSGPPVAPIQDAASQGTASGERHVTPPQAVAAPLR